jgi:8-oxo-dGTP diphosphatase
VIVTRTRERAVQAVTPNKPDTKLPPLPVTVDTVIFTVLDHTLQVLLVKRREEKFAGLWSLPGGFVAEDESLETAALRELEEATGVGDVYLEQLYTFGDPGRDTRGRVVSVAYVALLAADRCPLIPNNLEAEARWWPVYELPQLAFDHPRMIDVALDRVRTKLEYTTIGFQLMGATFTLGELQRIYEVVLDRKLDKRNFRRRLQLLDLVEPTGETFQDGPGRPAVLHRFRHVDFVHLRERGIHSPF